MRADRAPRCSAVNARTISGRSEKAENGAAFTVDFYLTYRKEASPEP